MLNYCFIGCWGHPKPPTPRLPPPPGPQVLQPPPQGEILQETLQGHTWRSHTRCPLVMLWPSSPNSAPVPMVTSNNSLMLNAPNLYNIPETWPSGTSVTHSKRRVKEVWMSMTSLMAKFRQSQLSLNKKRKVSLLTIDVCHPCLYTCTPLQSKPLCYAVCHLTIHTSMATACQAFNRNE